MSSLSLVVKAEDLWLRGPGFKPPLWRPFFRAPFIWIKAWNKICGKTLTWHCCMWCNLVNGRVDFEEWLAYKIQLPGIKLIVGLSADWDQSLKKHSSEFTNSFKKLLLWPGLVRSCQVMSWKVRKGQLIFVTWWPC